MKKLYQILGMAMLVILMACIPFSMIAQTETAGKEKKSKCEKAPSYHYWGVTLFGGANQFNGDLSKNLILNDKWMFGAGAMFSRQFTRVVGTRLKFGWSPLTASVTDKYVPYGYTDPYTGASNDYISQKMVAYSLEADAHVTINWVNWIWGNKPERFFSSYLIGGIGFDHTQGRKYDLNYDDLIIGYLGYPSHKGNEKQGSGNNSGLGSWNLEFKAVAGLGFDFNISKHWSINPEFIWRYRDGDALDMTKGGAKQIKNDMYSGAYLGVTYKFGYGDCLKQMEKRYGEVTYEVTPAVLAEKGDSVEVTIKGCFPEKYFCPKGAMYFQPVLKYEGGSYALKPMQVYGEKLSGDGTMIRYKEGGCFTYKDVIPYKPEMNTSMLTVVPTIYESKDKVIAKKEDIKAKARNIDLPGRDLAPGIIYTPTRILFDMIPILAANKYVRDIVVSKTGVIYFKKNKYDLDLNFGINKTQPAKDALTALNDFIKQGWKIKDIRLNGWASPEGEETFNANLSQNRAKTGNSYMIDQFKAWVKAAEKDNKNKKEVKEKVDNAGKDVNFVLASHGPDWNGFMRNVEASSIKDKNKILNVVNSAGDNLKKEQEIRNMILIYPEIEKDLLPNLRRCEITANLYQPFKTDAEISSLAVSNPDKLTVEEILYAGTLTNDKNTRVTIYENAARVYPNDWRANNNAAFANIQVGQYDKASNYLQKAAALAPNNGPVENNIGVVAAMNKDYKKAEAQFSKAAQLGENTNYNLGTLMIPKGDYVKANQLLANSKCTHNLGLAQLVSGNVAAAQTTLGCAPQTPETFYLLAICGARSNNTAFMYENLSKAVADPKLKSQAKGDREFYKYKDSQDFKNLVK